MGNKLSKEEIETDVLIAGGGPAALMAAIRSRELGKEATLVDKAHPKRSGGTSTGNDHFICYIPEIHGDLEPFLDEMMESLVGSLQNRDIAEKFLKKSFDIVQKWEDWGIPMKFEGDKYEFKGHAMPGKTRIFLKIRGENIKPVLNKVALNKGTTLIDRCQITNILVEDGKAVGAIGVDTREEKMYVFQAKSVVLATGLATRLYPNRTEDQTFNTAWPPHNAGGGIAMAYNAGADLVNMEFPYRHSGPKYYVTPGKASWIGLLRDSEGNTLNPHLEEPSREYGDVIADIWPEIFEKMREEGKAPIYMDCRSISKEDEEYMKKGLKHEGCTALLDYMERVGIDIQEDKVEFTTYEMYTEGGIKIDKNGESSVDGLFAAGDLVGNFRADLGGAATYGWIAGENAANYADSSESVTVSGNPVIEEKMNLFSEILSRDVGANWQEASTLLQQIMEDYAGTVRSESLLGAGLDHIKGLKEDAIESLTAENPHELMHCIEILNQLDLAQTIFLTASEREETRHNHVRTDFTYTDPLKNRFLIIRKTDGTPKLEWGGEFGEREE